MKKRLNDYEYLTTHNARIKDRVILANPSSFYSINKSNPAIHSNYFCHGVVETTDNYGISVKWDNGSNNVYVSGELALSSDKSINKNGRYISIW